MTQPAAISVRALSKKYRLFDRPIDRVKEALSPFGTTYHRDFWALRDVSFEVARGQTCGIIGRNGSGKSTLLQIIASVMQPTAGSVQVDGRIASLLELGGGFNPEMSGRENAVFYGRMMGLAEAEARSRIADVERFADIGEFFDRPVKIYSSGMFVRLAFAAAVNVDPDILIIDEALSVGDAKFQQKCFHKIQQFRDRGSTILLVTHAWDLVMRICDSAILLDSGRMIEGGVPGQVVNRYHALLFANDRISGTEPARGTAASGVPSAGDQTVVDFLADLPTTDRSPLRPMYNANETVLGDRSAEIIDYLIVAGGRAYPAYTESGETIDVYIKVRFREAVPLPVIGFAMTLADGLIVLGTNTYSNLNAPAAAEPGDVIVYKLSFAHGLTGGDYFFNFGVSQFYDHEQVFLHVRRSIAHLTVAKTPWCSGFLKVRPEFSERPIRASTELVAERVQS